MSWTITGSQKVNWDPSLISTALWLDAADNTTVFSDAGTTQAVAGSSTVQQWNDKSGNGRHATQATSINRPAYTVAGQNSRNVLTFDGSNDGLALAADLNIKPEHTIFVAAANSATITTSTTAQVLLSGSGYTYPSTTTSELLLGVGSVTGNLTNERLYSVVAAYGFGGGADVVGYAKTNTDVSGGFFLSSSFTTTNSAFAGKLNGASDFATASNTGGYASNDTRYPSAIRGIGYRFLSSSLNWNGQIWEIVIVPSVVSSADLVKMEGYLAHKWGLTANLPANHLYKVNPPAP